MHQPRLFKTFALLLALALSGGCASLSTEHMAGNLSRAMLNQDDPQTVHDGAPAYLLLVDSLIEGNPQDRTALIAGARLYGAYATGLVTDPIRAKRLSAKSRSYGSRALCSSQPAVCAHEKQPFETFTPLIDQIGNEDLKALYTYGTSWAAWIQARSDDWSALADLPKVEHVMARVIALDERHDRGRAQLYLAVMRTHLPPALGGKPETGRLHFERAIEYSNGRDLMAKVEFARRYARLVFDQALHDRLLQEVLTAPAEEPELTLSNILAQEQARALLADDYF
ncbi:TRAP transporter TatT component family protein [Pseudomonadota bacterium]